MASYCKITLIGNVGKDPELRIVSDGKKVASFSLAINDPLNKQQPPTWYKISVWGNRADTIMNYVRQGNNLFVEGRLDLREYTDQTGVKRTSAEVTANDFQFLGGKEQSNPAPTQSNDNAEKSGSAYPAPVPDNYNKNDDDDLPF